MGHNKDKASKNPYLYRLFVYKEHMSVRNTEHTHRMVLQISETEYALGMVPWIAYPHYVDILTALLKKALIRWTQIRIW